MAAKQRGLAFRIIHPGHVTSLAEAAAACGVPEEAVVKTLVVRRGEGDYVLVLVPGDRSLSWKKLRAVLGVNRIALPDADEARAATGYARGTISPLGLALPVVADERIRGREITLGTGLAGTVVALDADALIASYEPIVADVTDDAR
ncbi:MAG: aminoacyl-tRNA deacylase [Actinomycetota bacterium]